MRHSVSPPGDIHTLLVRDIDTNTPDSSTMHTQPQRHTQQKYHIYKTHTDTHRQTRKK